MKGNDFVIFALRSPLHGLMGDTMLVTVTGCKSGRKITLPVNYLCEGNTLWIMTSRDRTWWRNLEAGAPVEIRLHGHGLHGVGEAVLDEAAVAARMNSYLCQVPAAARTLKVRMKNGVPDCEDVQRVAREHLFVRICVE